jgi:[acyl-carrier-protein] S-malonyltransferase
MDAIAERRVRRVLELGPGTTLARLWNARHPAIPARAIDEFRSPAAAARWVLGATGGADG